MNLMDYSLELTNHMTAIDRLIRYKWSRNDFRSREQAMELEFKYGDYDNAVKMQKQLLKEIRYEKIY